MVGRSSWGRSLKVAPAVAEGNTSRRMNRERFPEQGDDRKWMEVVGGGIALGEGEMACG